LTPEQISRIEKNCRAVEQIRECKKSTVTPVFEFLGYDSKWKDSKTKKVSAITQNNGKGVRKIVGKHFLFVI
jgi:hypothetical protein